MSLDAFILFVLIIDGILTASDIYVNTKVLIAIEENSKLRDNIMMEDDDEIHTGD